MCGIAGIVSSDQEQLRRIRGMAHLLKHRGPDDEGFLFAGPGQSLSLGGDSTPDGVYAAGLAKAWRIPDTNSYLALGHRRLSIIDLSVQGHQPMGRSGHLWLVYNGEVFNYIELRHQLIAEGEHFQSGTDSEVILAAYGRWGKQCFERFNGMWALAIYDARTGELILSRDRFGVKPLYYWRTRGVFAFASEIKAFRALSGWRARCNEVAAGRFLALDVQDTNRETMLQDVCQVEPGHFITFQPQAVAHSSCLHVNQRRWYHLQAGHFEGDFDDAASEFRRLFLDAVRLRLRSDVELGFCLSGGLDSSSILCSAADLRASPEPILRSFTSCSNLAAYDERFFADAAAEAAKANPTYIYPHEAGLFRELRALIWAQDEPFSSTSIYAQWCVFAAAARAEVKVMLDGQGADESLCGYPNFLRPYLLGLVSSGQAAIAWREALALRQSRGKALSALLRAATDAMLPQDFLRSMTRKRREKLAPAWLDQDIVRYVTSDKSRDPVARGSSAGELSIKLLTGEHVQELLHWEDRSSMAHSIESRVPFLDYRLVEFNVSLPDTFKIREGRTKAILRRGLRGIVPDIVLDRRDKLGFVTPEAEWAQSSARKHFKDGLLKSIDITRGLVMPQITDEFDAAMEGIKPYSTSYWRALCFGQWMDIFDVSR